MVVPNYQSALTDQNLAYHISIVNELHRKVAILSMKPTFTRANFSSTDEQKQGFERLAVEISKRFDIHHYDES